MLLDLYYQVNGQRMNDCSHEEAALALKGAGSTVTLVVQHHPDEFMDFQQRLQQLQELQATSAEPSTSPGIKPPPVKQLYVRYLHEAWRGLPEIKVNTLVHHLPTVQVYRHMT